MNGLAEHLLADEVTPTDLAVHGLLCSAATVRCGRNRDAIERIESSLAEASARLQRSSTLVDDAGLPLEQALLAQAVHDGQADAASARAWRSLVDSQPACLAFEQALAKPITMGQPLVFSESLAERIVADLPTAAPSRPSAQGMPLAPLLAVVLLVSVISAVALAGARQIDMLGLLLLLVNCLVIAGVAMIGLRWLRMPFIERSGLEAQGLFDSLFSARLRPAPAAAFVIVGLIAPGVTWLWH